MDDTELVDHLSGQIQGLLALARALVKTHHDPVLLSRHFRGAEQAGLAKLEIEPVSDDVIDGFRFVCDQIYAVLKSSQEHPSDLGTS